MAPPSVLRSCTDALVRMPPDHSVAKELGLLAGIAEHGSASAKVADEFPFQLGGTPPKVSQDTDGRSFILCQHNRFGETYRSPWNNQYLNGAKGPKPPRRLRELELHANEVFDCYRRLYYGGESTSSVYIQEQEGGGSDVSAEFTAVFVVSNTVNSAQYWKSTHIFDVGSPEEGRVLYKLRTMVSVSLSPSSKRYGQTSMRGCTTNQMEKQCSIKTDSCHIANMGHMVEDIENELRSSFDSLHVQKTRSVIESIRHTQFQGNYLNMHGSSSVEEKEHIALLSQAVKQSPTPKKLIK
uniref:F-actin-capping protein subunit beta n=1 Tax=Odontella aurita TaxID=265563 RepID=A0A7S4K493_9STRA|mmetsp:Transcript_61093/g.180718  ORF Transcript_61093/g.180718 Transcript_61093/m.180718 type:complete len:296 (+) Transcript_61093:300-1187(+)